MASKTNREKRKLAKAKAREKRIRKATNIERRNNHASFMRHH